MDKIIFIDRDGVINKDPGGWTEHNYVTRWEDFHFLPGAKEALKLLNDNGYDIIMISNQGGVSKRCFSQEALDKITDNMLREIEASGAKIKKVYYCVHHDKDNCACRKPKTGLFSRAEKELGIKSAGAYFIGDGKTDVQAGRSMGLKTVLVLSGKTALEDIEGWEIKPDHIVKDLQEAVKIVINDVGHP
ncbi:MAG: HAD family hydrolase [Candidatus Omnitrophica bacterium]|nr:HAD family hydrolase [Candidatus Omnitrophota bacterium]